MFSAVGLMMEESMHYYQIIQTAITIPAHTTLQLSRSQAAIRQLQLTPLEKPDCYVAKVTLDFKVGEVVGFYDTPPKILLPYLQPISEQATRLNSVNKPAKKANS